MDLKKALDSARLRANFLLLLILAITMVFASHWPLLSMPDWLSDISKSVGLALFVGVSTAWIITKWTEERLVSLAGDSLKEALTNSDKKISEFHRSADEKLLEMRGTHDKNIQDIKQDVFHGVLETVISPVIFDTIKGSIIQNPLIREKTKIKYNLIKENRTVNGNSQDVVRCECVTEYNLINLQKRTIPFPLYFAVYTRDFPGLEKECALTRFIAGDMELSETELAKEATIDDEGFLCYSRKVNIKEGENLYISYKTICFKDLKHSDTYESLLPSDGLELKVDASHFKDIRVIEHIMTSHKVCIGGEDNPPNMRHWRVDRGILPHQGVSITWAGS